MNYQGIACNVILTQSKGSFFSGRSKIRIFIEPFLDATRNPLKRYFVEGGEQSHGEGSKKAGQPQGKHERYIDANSGLAGGIYTGEERYPRVKHGRRAFCSRPRRSS